MEKGSGDGTNWFLVRQGRRHGPYDRRALVQELLAADAPEATLVWHTGLPEWVKAGEVADLARELPPPIPGVKPAPDPVDFVPPLPRDAGGGSAGPAGEAEGADDDEAAEEPAEPRDESKGTRRRHRHRPRHRAPAGIGAYVIPLVVLFVTVMLGLWLLLRRMNEVPPGRIIQEGRSWAPQTRAETPTAGPLRAG
jgi:hypothetical protein